MAPPPPPPLMAVIESVSEYKYLGGFYTWQNDMEETHTLYMVITFQKE